MKDNLQKAAFFAEIISAVAIVLSLIFVAFQISENTDSQRAATAQDIARDFMVAFDFTLEEDELFHKGYTGEVLTEIEQIKLFQLYAVLFRTYENMWYQARNGSMDPVLYQGYRNYIRRPFASPAGRDIWGKTKASFHPDFVRDTELFVESSPQVISLELTVPGKGN